MSRRYSIRLVQCFFYGRMDSEDNNIDLLYRFIYFWFFSALLFLASTNNTVFAQGTMVDTDQDGLTDSVEQSIGTNPLISDTDGGGVDDGPEVLDYLTDPLDSGDDFQVISLPFDFVDGGGFLWDILEDGEVGAGGPNSVSLPTWNNALELSIYSSQFVASPDAVLTTLNRELILDGASSMNGIQVQRRIYVSEDDSFARYVERLHNTTLIEKTVRVRLHGDYHVDADDLLVETASGDGEVDVSENYIIVRERLTGITAVQAISGAGQPEFEPDIFNFSSGDFVYRFQVTIPAGETASIMHFTSQVATITQAQTIAPRLELLDGDLLEGLPLDVLGEIVNYVVDRDHDGLLDVDESNAGTDINNPDTDGDGLLDGFEVTFGFNPLVDEGNTTADTDGDGLDNLTEQQAGSSPLTNDTDGDGVLDPDELALGTGINDTDTDNDQLSDGDELSIYSTDPLLSDTDMGGATDGEEVLEDQTNPFDPNDDIVTVSLPFDLIDGGGFLWDIQGSGRVGSGGLNGANDPSWDVSAITMRINSVFFPSASVGELLSGGREIEINSPNPMSNLQVQRRIFVPEDDSFARYVDRLHNPTLLPIFASVSIDSNHTFSNWSTVDATGDNIVSFIDNYVIITENSTDISLTHAVFGEATPAVTPLAVRTISDNFDYVFSSVVVPPGETISIMHFVSQTASLTQAQLILPRLIQPDSAILKGLPSSILNEVVNYDLNAELMLRDSDSDGVTDAKEIALGTDFNNWDSDGDGLSDGFELTYGFNPLMAGEALLDPDGDGLNNLEEQANGTSPLNNDAINVPYMPWQFLIVLGSLIIGINNITRSSMCSIKRGQ